MSVSLKSQYKTYKFWFGIASAILLLIQAIGEPLGLKVNEECYMSVVNAILGVFVFLGILSGPCIVDTNTQGENTTKQEQK